LPTQRTVQSLYTIAPTVARSGLRDASGRDRDPSVGGSSGPENNYILDGVNTTDPAFGGSGANLPFEFVQEVEIKTGAYGAEYGRATGGIFNVSPRAVVTNSTATALAISQLRASSARRSNSLSPVQLRTASPKSMLVLTSVDQSRKTRSGSSQHSTHSSARTISSRKPSTKITENKITTPFYSGKVTWAINPKHTFTFSTFGDFTKQEGFLFGGSGFGSDPATFQGEIQTGGHNYAARLNSTFSQTWIGEFAFGLHLQRSNVLPLTSVLGTPLLLTASRF
jgi:Outer membrane receptor proteins, mostly Fe transport